MTKIKLPEMNWFGTKHREYSLPDRWQVEVCNMAGYDRPAITRDQINAALNNPFGTRPLRELAAGKKEIVIIFDDMSRVTRAKEIVREILAELAAAGIKDKQIRFVCALGCHGALTRIDFVKKLGEDVLARFPVYNHNPFGNCVSAGKTKTYGTELEINEEVMSCDFKIAIGAVVPHPMSGFGGGGKIILPGICSIKSILHNHDLAYRDMMTLKGKMGVGRYDENPMRLDIEEAPEMVGLNFLVNALLNANGETAGLFCGAFKPAYAEAVKAARIHYLTQTARDKDICIANAFVKTSEPFIGLNIANLTTNREKGGEHVLIANAPEGMVPHYLLGPFGKDCCGPSAHATRILPFVKRLIIYTEYPELASIGWYGNHEKIVFAYKWDDVLKLLEEDYPATAKVGVFPNSEIQYI